MFKRTVKVVAGIGGVTITGSLVYALAQNEWDVSSLGIVRFGRVAKVATQCSVDYKWSLRGLESQDELYRKTKNEAHERCAKRLLEMCRSNRGCFIKVGQHLGTLDYLLPHQYVRTMKVLHDRAPETSLNEMLHVFEEEFGKKVNEVFRDFDEKPLGAASLAQVYRATLHSGDQVAVKIQHPFVQRHAAVDMTAMEVCVRFVSWLFPEFDFQWLAEETKRNLPVELDFYNEGKNCERAGRMLQKFPFLEVPRIYWKLTSKRVLTMQYCSGGRVDDGEYMARNQININEVSSALGKLYSEMIFVNGVVHCDPHPGNVMVKRDEAGRVKLSLLDHGLYQSLTDDFRLEYCRLWQALISGDVDKIKLHATNMNCGHVYGLFACMLTARSWNAVTNGIDKVTYSQQEENAIQSNASTYLPQIADILNSVPRQMLLLLKTNDVIRGIEHSLGTRSSASSFLTMSRCCIRALAAEDRRNSNSFVQTVRLHVSERWQLLRLSLYSLTLKLYAWYYGPKYLAEH